jgi:site-specific recombinase XerC
VREGEREAPNPMERIDEPKVTRRIKPVLPGADLAALLRACEAQDFKARRDMAIERGRSAHAQLPPGDRL